MTQFVSHENVHELETRKSVSQKIAVGCFRLAECASLSQPAEKIIQVPAHQFKPKNFVRSCRGFSDVSNIGSKIRGRVQPVEGRKMRHGRAQEKLLWPACPACGVQPVGKQIAARTRNGANHITPTRMAQIVKQTANREI